MKRLVTSGMVLSLAALALPAHADDTKFYPGTMCQGAVGESYSSQIFVGSSPATIPGVFVRPATYSTTGAALNWSSAHDMTMVCPIVRDVVRADNLGWTSLVVNVLNTSASRDLSCTAESFYPWDYGFGSMSSNTLHANTNWTDLALSAVSLPQDGYMLIHCLVPRVDDGDYPSGIASYRIDE